MDIIATESQKGSAVVSTFKSVLQRHLEWTFMQNIEKSTCLDDNPQIS